MANKVAPVAAAYLVEDDDKSSDIKKKPAHADGLKRQQSIKIAADHAKEHKYKYLTACVAIIVALVVGLVLGLAVLFFLQSKGVLNASLSAQLTAIKGTTIEATSVLPSKGESRRRRLLESDIFDAAGMLTETFRPLTYDPKSKRLHPRVVASPGKVVDPSKFEQTSDYNVDGEPTYVVSDKSSSDAIGIIDTIRCSVNQLRAANVGLNYTFNSAGKPFIAIVDNSLCDGGSATGVEMWYAQSKGPDTFGDDGLYTTNAFFLSTNDGDSEPIFVMFENTIKGGNLTTSNVFINSKSFGRGVLSISHVDSTKDDIIFSVENLGLNLRATYNPTTSRGSAITTDFGGENKYALDFSETLIHRRKTDKNDAMTMQCFDYSLESRMLTGKSYNLFSALDGSKKFFQSGFPIYIESNAFTKRVEAYAGFFGLFTTYAEKTDGSYGPTDYLFTDRAQVNKVNYDAKQTVSTYTLRVAPAQLFKITRHEVTLADIAGLPMVVEGGSLQESIVWDAKRHKLYKISEIINGCVNRDGEPVDLVEGEYINSYDDCSCLADAGSGKKTVSSSTSMVPDRDTYYFYEMGESFLNETVEFVPSAEEYPYGIQVRNKAGNFQGYIIPEYEFIQTLYGVKSQQYVKGDNVSQKSSGATGIVYESTPLSIWGLHCYECMKYNEWSGGNCAFLGAQKTASFVPSDVLIFQKQESGKLGTLAVTGSTYKITMGSTEFSGVKAGMMITGTSLKEWTFISKVTTSGNSKLIYLTKKPTVSSGVSISDLAFYVVGITTDHYSNNEGVKFEYYCGEDEDCPVETAMYPFQTDSSASTVYISSPESDNGYSYRNVTGSFEWDINTGLVGWMDYINWGQFGGGGTDVFGVGCHGSSASLSVSGVTNENFKTSFWDGLNFFYPEHYLSNRTGYLTISGRVSNPTSTSTVLNVTFGSGDLRIDDYLYGYDFPINVKVTAVDTVRELITINRHLGDSAFAGRQDKFVRFMRLTDYGRDCNTPVAEVQVTSSGGACTTLPKVTVYCNRRISSEASMVTIQLPSPDSAKFKSNYDYHSTKDDIVLNGIKSGHPFFSWVEQGDMLPVNSTTKVAYRTVKLVVPGDTVPDLLCSGSDCPMSSALRSSNGNPYYSAPSHLSNRIDTDTSGQCYDAILLGDLTVTYTGFESDPEVAVIWANYSTDGFVTAQGFEVKDPGSECSSPSIKFSGPVMTATTTASSKTITVQEFSSGKFAHNMNVTVKSSSSGVGTNSTLVSCTSFSSSGATCQLGHAAASSGSVTIVGHACISYPAGTPYCEYGESADYRSAIKYSFDSLEGVLTDTTSVTGGKVYVGTSNAVTIEGDSLYVGPLFEGSASNKAKLVCDWDASQACPWKAYDSLDEFYIYYSNSDHSSDRVTLVDEATGKAVEFSQPDTLMYTHSGTDSLSGRNYDGVTMFLDYNGPGSLYGFPEVCVDPETNEPGSCISSGSKANEAYSDISIPLGGLMKSIDDEYFYAKASEFDERYPVLPSATRCTDAGLDFSSLPIVPDIKTLYKTPEWTGKKFPTSSQLMSDYLNEGKPVVVGGITLYEYQALLSE